VSGNAHYTYNKKNARRRLLYYKNKSPDVTSRL